MTTVGGPAALAPYLTLRLLLLGRIREQRVIIRLVGWSLGLLLLVDLSIIWLLHPPALWEFLATINLLAIFALGLSTEPLRSSYLPP
jgi:hypothetical protein